MLQKVSPKSRIAIALLLISGFVLALTILPHAIGHVAEHIPDVDTEINGDPEVENVSENVTLNPNNGTGYASITVYAERHDDNSNTVGTASATVGASYNKNAKRASYWVSAVVNIYGCDENQMPLSGSANTWGKVPTLPTVHDKNPDGDVTVDACCLSSIGVYNYIDLGFAQLGHRVAKASAAITVHKYRPRISVKVEVRNI